MGNQYRPKIVERCYPSQDGDTPIPGSSGFILRVSNTDLYDKLTDNSGSRAYNDVSFWRAKQFTNKGTVFYPVGDIAMGPSRNGENTQSRKHVGQITYPYTSRGPSRETIIISGDVKGPINYELLWSNQQEGNPFWIWRPIAPANYIALGDVITTSANPPLTGDNAPIRCVPYDMIIKLPANGNVLWSSNGSSESANINLLGFVPNYGGYSSSSGGNAYNLFRGVLGYGTSIPDSDINGSFYYIDTSKYDPSIQIGLDTGIPDTGTDANRVGKGFIPTNQKDSKYSVIAYLNLKNQPLLTHRETNIQLNGQIIDNAIGNTYTITFSGRCLNNNNGAITLTSCDNEQESQFFSIMLTGNKKDECRIQHKTTGKFLKYKAGLFSLQDSNLPEDQKYLLFLMS
jgi:hypothetical protein